MLAESSGDWFDSAIRSVRAGRQGPILRGENRLRIRIRSRRDQLGRAGVKRCCKRQGQDSRPERSSRCRVRWRIEHAKVLSSLGDLDGAVDGEVVEDLAGATRGPSLTCLIDTQVARMVACVSPRHVWAGGHRPPGLKGTSDARTDLPATARAASARSGLPLSTEGYGLVCSGERRSLSP